MNKFVSTALGLAAVGSIGSAGTGDGDWLGLDGEIKDLSSAFAPAQGSGSGWSGLLRVTYGHSSDDISTGGGDDLSGFTFGDADLAFWTSSGDYNLRVSGDLDLNGSGGSSFELEDAYVGWPCGAGLNVRLGNLKPSVLRSANIDPEDTLFIDRTVMGASFDFWDTGVMVMGSNSGVNWAASMTNGSTSAFSDHFISVRGSYDLGDGAGSYEGARGGGNDQFNGTVGLAITNHSGAVAGPSDNQSIFVDFHGTFGQFGFGFEVGQVDDDDSGAVSGDFGQINGTPIMIEGDTSPWAATFSFLVNPEVEVGLRLEDLDDTDDTSLLTLGASYYRNGNNAKWQAQFTDVSRDAGDEGSYLQIGLTAGASR